jgi:hypothetical protein
MNIRPTITSEFANLFVKEPVNLFRSGIQGLVNEPITVLALLRRAEALHRREPDFGGLGDASQEIIVEWLASDRPRVCGIIPRTCSIMSTPCAPWRVSGGTAVCPSPSACQ